MLATVAVQIQLVENPSGTPESSSTMLEKVDHEVSKSESKIGMEYEGAASASSRPGSPGGSQSPPKNFRWSKRLLTDNLGCTSLFRLLMLFERLYHLQEDKNGCYLIVHQELINNIKN